MIVPILNLYPESAGVEFQGTGGYSDNPNMIREFGKNPDRIDPMGAGGIYGDSYDVSICEGSCQGFAVYSTTQNPAVKLFCEEVNRVSWPYKT